MPQAIPAAAMVITKAAVALGATGAVKAAVFATSTFLLKAAVSTAASVAIGLLTTPKVDVTGSPTDWTSDPNAPVAALFGEMEGGGQIVARKAFGDENMYQAVVGVVSVAGPIAGIDAVLIEKEVVGINPTTQQADPPYGDKFWFSYQLGAQPEAVALQSPAGLRGGVDMPGWTAAHKLSGKAAYMATFGHDSKQKIWKRGNLPEFAVRARGQRLYDLRKDSTFVGGVGSHRLTNAATWEYSANGPLCALKWALGLWESATGKGVPGIGQKVLGIGLDLEEIDLVSFAEGANLADALGWVLTARPTADDDPWEVLKAMLQAGGCAPIHVDGVLTCIPIAAAKTSVVTLETEDILGAIQYARTPSRLDRKNSAFPRFRSPAHNYDMVTADIVERDIYLTEDGGRRRSQEVDLPCVPDVEQAATLAAYWVADSREGFIGGVQVNPHLRGIKPGRCFTMPTDPSLGEISGKKLYIIQRKLDTKAHVLTWSFREETDSKHPWAGGIVGTVVDPVDPDTPPVDLAAPDAADWTLTGGTLGTGAGLPALFVDGVCTNPLAGGVVLEYRVDGTSEWSLWTEGDPNDEHYETTNVAPATDYEVSLRFRDERTGIISENRLILGPETTGGVVIDWTDQPPIDPDLLDDWNVLRRAAGGEFTGDLDATVGATWGVDVADRPANLAGLAGSEPILNTDISINANGSLNGAGGGGVTLSGLGFTGDLDATNDDVVVALADTLGPLATSGLTEDKVQGRFLGYHAGDAAAITAGLQDGDAYVDTSVTPPAFKVQAGGSIQEVDTSGTFRDYTAQADITASPGTYVTMAEVDLTNITADSFVTVWMSMAVEVTPDQTRKSGGSAGVNPAGSWRILECATGAANPTIDPVLMSGSWLAQRVGSGAGADNIDYFDIDGSANAASDISRRWLVRAGGGRTWYLQMSKTGSESLLNAGVTLYAQIQRNPLQ